jgi:uracil-DNA glycosylase
MAEPPKTIEELHEKCIASGKYPLLPGATRLVPGHGNPHAAIMCIGEAPGADEDKLGIPFVGRAGQFFNELLQSIGLNREDIYISNMVKSRPPGNRDPEESEIKLFKPWLDWEIKLIKPKVFIPLGRFALSRFLPGVKISQVHGKAFRRDDHIFFVMYHPAAALYNGSMRPVLIEDMKTLRRILDGDESMVEDLATETSETVKEIQKLLAASKTNSPDRSQGSENPSLLDL